MAGLRDVLNGAAASELTINMRILAISGSLRRTSSNTTLLRALAILAPACVEVALYDGLASLPAFNPDLEGAEPSSVLDFRAQIQAADGVFISSPEYAHGVPGSLKNALDWIVGSGELLDKPVAMLNTSSMAKHAQASLKETMTVMSARLITEASLTIPLQGRRLDEFGIAADPELSRLTLKAITELTRAVESLVPNANPSKTAETKTPQGYTIRLARSEYLPALRAIELAAAEMFRGYVPDSVPLIPTEERKFSDAARDGRLWVTLKENIPVGFALVEMLADDLPHLEELDVEPSHGRRGLGTSLVRAACEWATVSKYTMLTLTTFRFVPWNFPLYARLGFEEIPHRALRPELAAVVSAEARRGLDPEVRAVMGFRCEPSFMR